MGTQLGSHGCLGTDIRFDTQWVAASDAMAWRWCCPNREVRPEEVGRLGFFWAATEPHAGERMGGRLGRTQE
jgi:hypothetical protein